jgi:GT2 family glycosyltransferase/glycosyltransferase involved in cell wall biosynthesis
MVSVVLVNFRGASDTLTCLGELARLNFAATSVELICVDNCSGDDSVEVLRSLLPANVRLIEASVNGGFTGGCNLGAAAASGEFLAFINNDARPHRDWLAAAVVALESDATIGCIASKVLDWDGVNVDYVDAGLTWFGMGYKPLAGSPDDGSHEAESDVLFPTGSAMVLRAALFQQLGGFDERFFMFYEDVDLGWRMNLLGHRVRYVPTSVVFHRHHATMNKFGSYREWYLLERNALMCLYKNLEQSTLERVLAPAMALAIRRSLVAGEADSTLLDLQRTAGGDGQPDATVSKRSLSGAYAIDGFLEHLPSLTGSRDELQRRRLRSDRQLAPLMRQPMEPALSAPHYLAGYQSLVEAFELADLYPARGRILVVTGDPLSPQLAGPAIRAFNIAQELSRDNEVRLVSTRSCVLENSGFTCSSVAVEKLHADVAWAEVIIFQGFLLHEAPWLADTGKILIPDMYDPMHLERLEQTRGTEPLARDRDLAATLEVVNAQLLRGDFFLCANERQRHFWLGQLAALGRLNARTYDHDQNLDGLVAVAPFGLPRSPPQPTRAAIKGSVPGIGADDKVILWAGGIYDWFDPLSLVRAVAELSHRRPAVRLFFLGTQNPNPGVPPMPMVASVIRLADELGLTGKHVFFNEGWVDYADRVNYLADADVGVSTHFAHLETTYSFRTRMLDYLWAGLPIVASEGDYFAELIAAEGIGLAVRAGDVSGLADALERCLYDDAFAAACRKNIERVRPRFEWSRALAPLVEFCRAPHRAWDAPSTRSRTRRPVAVSLPKLRQDLALAREYLAEGGVANLTSRVAGRLRRTLTRG